MNQPGQPPPLQPVPTEAPQLIPVFRIRDLRRNINLAPGGALYPELVAAYLPLVSGIAGKITGVQVNASESSEGAAAFQAEGSPVFHSPATQFAVEAVFEVFGKKWKRLSRSVCLSAWFIRTTFYIASAQADKSGAGRPLKGSERQGYNILTKKLLKLSIKLQEPFVLAKVLGLNTEAVAAKLKLKEPKLIKYAAAAEKTLGTALRKRKLDPAAFPISGMAGPAPGDLVDRAVKASIQPVRQDENKSLIKAALSGWRWHLFSRFIRITAKCVGLAVLGLTCIVGTFAYLAHNGYLNSFFATQHAKNIAKQFPELNKPSGPFPDGTNTSAAVRTKCPQSASELFSPTNIWLASFHFTTDQWKAIAPSNIPSARLFQNGKIHLRNPKAKRSGLSGMVGLEFNYTAGNLTFGDQFFEQVGVRYRGNGTFLNSRHGNKQSFKVDMNEYVKGQKIAGVKTLNFLNSIADDSYLRDVLAQRFFTDLGAVGPRTSYAYLTLDVPGKFDKQALGLYVLMENIDADFAKDRFDDKSVPIFKPVTHELFKDLGSEWAAYATIYDLKTKATPEEEQRVIDFAKLVTHASDAEFAKKLAEFLDMEEFSAFLAGHVILSSYDGFLENGQNFYIYLNPKTMRFGFIPWDQDHSWGEFGYVGTPETREKASIWNPSTYDFRFLKRVMAVDAFKDVYRKKLEEAMEKYFIKDRIYAQIDELTAQIRPAVAAESAFRLKRFDEAISSTWPDGPRTRHGPREGPGAQVQQLKRFIENRIQSVRNQLDGKEEGVELRRGR